MKKKHPFICLFLVSSLSGTYAQELKMNYCPDFSRPAGQEKKPFLSWFQAGFQPGAIHFKIKDEPAPATGYVKVGDGYFKRQPINRQATYDTIKDKTLFYVLFKPVFHINLSHRWYIFTAPEAAITFNAKNHSDYGVSLNDMEVGFEKYDMDNAVAYKTALGAEAGLGYVFNRRSILQFSAESVMQYDGQTTHTFHENLLATFHFRIFS